MSSLTNSIRYVEFDSSFRNRKQYPNPASFIVEASQTAQGDRFTALDPVCDSSPILVFDFDFIDDNFVIGNTITGITVSPTTLPSLQGNTLFQITTALAGFTFRLIRNYYVGASLSITNAGITTVQRIVEYQPINSHNAILRIDAPLPNTVIGLNTFHIDCPTPLPTDTANSVIKCFIPGSNDCKSDNCKLQLYGLGGDNYYVNYYIQEQSTRVYRKIIAFDAETRLATLDADTGPPAVGTDWNEGLIAFPKIFSIRKEIPIRALRNIFTTTTQIEIQQFGDPLSNVNNFYVGYFLRILPNDGGDRAPYPPPYNEERRIVAYDGTTQIVTVSPPFSALPLPGFLALELEPFTRDSAIQFNFTGPLVTSDQTETYEVELLNLVLPNTLLESGRGGRAIFYPYFYVELRQLSTSTTQSFNVIYSNNPNSYRMLFRAIVDDTPIPAISPFIKIDGDGMAHTIRIKPNDTFRFSVYHANGELFKTVIEDFDSPKEPNPLVQISACFSFKKV